MNQLATTAKYVVKTFPTYFQIEDSDDGFVIFRSSSLKEIATELRHLDPDGVAPAGFLWELETVKLYCPVPVPGATRAHLRLEGCDKNIDRVRALYREIKGRDLDEQREDQGFYRYPPGPVNMNPESEQRFGHRIKFRARFLAPDGKWVQHDSMEVVLSMLYAGYDLGFNDLQ